MELPGTNNTTNIQSQTDGISDKETFLSKYYEYRDMIKNLVDENQSKTFYKFSDGEYFWLNNHQIGSVAAGRRDSNTTDRDLTPFREGVIQNDYLMCQALNEHIKWYKNYFGVEPKHYVDYAYALCANKWFTKTFNGKIGLIGASPKMDLISKLCDEQEYLDYLEFDGFSDYIHMPQRYLCDNLDEGEKILSEQLPKSKCDIFLVGIGHAQQALLHRMKKYKDAVYIVVGSMICAYAGVQDNKRPYCGDWMNFKLKDYDYSTIDVWRAGFTNLKEI